MMGSLSDGKLVGLYGIQGVGKSYILNQIANECIEWRVCDGSDLIREVLRDRDQIMEHFDQDMTPIERADVRKAAIESVKKKPGITLVAGHGSFASKEDDDASLTFKDVFTPADGAAYDHIIYLKKPAEMVFHQVQKDNERSRATLSTEHLQLWMDHEKELLEAKCLEHGIAFQVFCLGGSNDHLNLIKIITEKVVMPACEGARLKSEKALLVSIKEVPAADVYLLIDGDRTLVPQDTGTLFFDQVSTLKVPNPLKKIFKRYDNYTFQAFWEVAILYSNVLSLDEYNSLCKKIGSEQVHVYEAWNSFLDGLPSNVHPIIVSSSIREVWLAMQLLHIEKQGQSSGLGRASVIAGNSLSLHSYIIDNHAKALVAKELRRLHCGCIIVGFGDSAIDVPMLCESDLACIVVDDKMNRSMKDYIAQSVRSGLFGNIMHQIIDLDPQAIAKHCHNGLPVQSLESLLDEIKTGSINSVIDASSRLTAQILATGMRDSKLQGPSLQLEHEECGKLLANLLIDRFGMLIGLVDKVEFSHVQGGASTGLGINSKSKVLILPLMRGGEPMARGVYSRFPNSSFIHFYDEEDNIDRRNNLLAKTFEQLDLVTPVTIILVDSVINTGSSIKRAIAFIHRLADEFNVPIQLIIMSGVIQKEAASLLPCQYPRARFITLRVSKNKYTGRGSSDTGNRLFTTTEVE